MLGVSIRLARLHANDVNNGDSATSVGHACIRGCGQQ
jgi:hypothetical protein